MRALVLGGSVFIGRRMVETLVADGHDVTVLNRGRTPVELPDGVGRLVADRTDAAEMEAALGGTSWDAVYDISGFVMVAGGSDITSLLDLMDGRAERYVYVSSIMAYDQSLVGVFPWTEDMPTNPDGPATYGGFKAVAEAAMLERNARTGFPVSIVRPAAVYGPYNNIYDMETPMFLRLLQRRPILLPHGGMTVASYGHVDDLCAAIAAMPGDGEVYNICAEAVSTVRYVEALAEIVGAAPDIVYVPDAALARIEQPVFGHLFGASHHAALSYDKARHRLGYEPRFDFVAGHADAYDWFCRQGWNELDGPLVDPVWHASWDFEAEAALAAELR